jgi:hypothetical protein
MTGNNDRLTAAILSLVFPKDRQAREEAEPKLAKSLQSAAGAVAATLARLRTSLAAAPAPARFPNKKAQFEALAATVTMVLLDLQRQEGGAASTAEGERLLEMLELRGSSDELLEVIRFGFDPKNGKGREIVERLRKECKEKEQAAMSLDRFAFDKGNLPPSLESAAAQQKYSDVVQEALKAFDKGDNDLWRAAVTGLLLIDGMYDPLSPALFDSVKRIVADLVSAADPTTTVDVANVGAVRLPNAKRKIDVFNKVMEQLLKITPAGEKIFFTDFARIGTTVIENIERRAINDPGFAGFVDAVRITNAGQAGNGLANGGGLGGINLPPLVDPGGGNDEIEPDNVRAVATIYVGFQLEQMGFFQVLQRVIELFDVGLLPIGPDATARLIERFDAPERRRLNETQRFAQYGRVLGFGGAGAIADINPNSEFSNHLLRFISSIAEFDRRQQISTLFENGNRRPPAMFGEYVRKSGRDFLANVSLYGWAGTHIAAQRIASHINDGMAILASPSLRQVYGAATPWQVIERISADEFGRNINVVKHRTLAEETRMIMDLAAQKHAVWGLSGERQLFALRPGDVADLSFDETNRLFRAAHYWNAVNGVQDTQILEYSQPVETPALPSLPNSGGGLDIGNLSQLRDMVSRGETPNLDQLRNMLPMM